MRASRTELSRREPVGNPITAIISFATDARGPIRPELAKQVIRILFASINLAKIPYELLTDPDMVYKQEHIKHLARHMDKSPEQVQKLLNIAYQHPSIVNSLIAGEHARIFRAQIESFN